MPPPDTNTPEHTQTPEHPGALVARELQRRFTTKAGETVGVHGVSLAVERGETVALLGPNGSGKSTLLGMLATIDPPDAGHIIIDGVTLDRDATRADLVRARRRLGVAFQSHALDPLLTVRENLAIAAALFALHAPSGRIDAVMERLRIADRAHDRVGTLSGGLARRADLARALLHEPAVLLLDEPTTGLDPDARTELLETLDALRAQDDAPAILHSTHLTDEAEHADRVLIIQSGRIITQGAPDDLRAKLGERALVLEHTPEAASSARARLAGLGLEPRPTTGRRTIAPLPDSDEADRIVRALLEEGERFRVGPPSLADVYTDAIERPARPAQAGNAEGATP